MVAQIATDFGKLGCALYMYYITTFGLFTGEIEKKNGQ